MRMASITLTMLSVNSLIARRAPMTVDQIRQEIRAASIFETLEHCLIEDHVLSGVPVQLSEAERAEILDALQRLENAVLAEELGVPNASEGFVFLNALFVQLIQSNVSVIELE